MKKNLTAGASGDAILLTMIKIVSMALSFFVTRLLSQYLSVYDYGTYSQVLLIVSTLSSITILGMSDGVNFFYWSERDKQKRESYIATIFVLQCAVSTVAGTVVMLLSAPVCQYFDNPPLKNLMIFSAVLPMLQNLMSMLQVLVVAIGKARLLACRNLIVSFVRLVAVVVVVMWARDVMLVLIAAIVLDIGQIVAFSWILQKNNCFIHLGKLNVKLINQILHYCVPMGIFISLKSVNRDIDKYLIAALVDTETLAIYTNASKPLPFDILMHSFYTVLIPEITKRVTIKDKSAAASLCRLLIEIGYLTTAIPCCAALAASPQLMKLLYSNKYLSGLPIFCVYLLVDLLQFTNITLVLSAAGKPKTLMILSAGALVANVILNILLYNVMGTSGPAVATLMITLFSGVLLLYLSARELGVNIVNLFDKKFFLVFSAESLGILMVIFQLQQWLDRQDVHYFVILMLVAGMYCGAMLLLHGRRVVKLLKSVNTTTRIEKENK